MHKTLFFANLSQIILYIINTFNAIPIPLSNLPWTIFSCTILRYVKHLHIILQITFPNTPYCIRNELCLPLWISEIRIQIVKLNIITHSRVLLQSNISFPSFISVLAVLPHDNRTLDSVINPARCNHDHKNSDIPLGLIETNREKSITQRSS